MQSANTIPIMSRKGISKTPVAFAFAKPIEASEDKSIMPGKNFRRTEKRNPPMVAKSAALLVVFFQKKPIMNMAKIPGETKPVYS